MKTELLDILACPHCAMPLEFSVLSAAADNAAEIVEGALLCKKCNDCFPIIGGIPRFIPNALSLFPEIVKKYPQLLDLAKQDRANFEKVHGSTQERFGFEWMNYPGPMEEDRKVFLEETQIPVEEWPGKRVLDAGCGMGRYSRIAHQLGATVVAMDLSPALVRLSDLALKTDRMHLVQANLLSLPFRPNAFDIVYSIGVIHHTPSAHDAFKGLSKIVKSGGKLSVWVYGKAGGWEQFKTNPLKKERQQLEKVRKLVWLVVSVRQVISDTLRFLTVRLPHRLVYLLSYPLALVGKIPFVKYLTFSVHPLWRVRLQENFDWLSPPYQSHHTKEELISWFKENQFEVLSVLPHGFVPKPGVLGRKKT